MQEAGTISLKSAQLSYVGSRRRYQKALAPHFPLSTQKVLTNPKVSALSMVEGGDLLVLPHREKEDTLAPTFLTTSPGTPRPGSKHSQSVPWIASVQSCSLFIIHTLQPAAVLPGA